MKEDGPDSRKKMPKKSLGAQQIVTKLRRSYCAPDN
jgi:hypothetical protein